MGNHVPLHAPLLSFDPLWPKGCGWGFAIGRRCASLDIQSLPCPARREAFCCAFQVWDMDTLQTLAEAMHPL